MKKSFLFLIPACFIVGSIVSVSADEGMQSTQDMQFTQSSQGTQSTEIVATSSVQTISLERQALQQKARLVRENNKQLRSTSKDTLKEFHATNSGAIHSMKKELTETDKIAIKKAHDERSEYIHSLSGLTLEQKAQYMSGIEDKIRHEIETRFSNSTGSIQSKRIEVYEQNAARRAEILMNQLDLRAARGNLRTAEIDVMIAKVTLELPNLSTEKKTKLVKKIDEKIKKIQANKRIPELNKTEIVTKLTTLKTEILK